MINNAERIMKGTLIGEVITCMLRVRIIRFMVVGGASLLVSLIVYYPLTLFLEYKTTFFGQVFYLPAILISTPTALAFAYYINRKWTFGNYRTRNLSLLRYELSGMSTAVLDVIALFLMVHYLHIYYLLAAILAAISMFGLRYIIASKWIWGKSR